MSRLSLVLSVASLVFGVLFYILAVGGVLWPATDPLDHGLVPTVAVFILFGVLGLFLGRGKPDVTR